MSEKADAACPDEFSAWTMTCAGKFAYVKISLKMTYVLIAVLKSLPIHFISIQ